MKSSNRRSRRQGDTDGRALATAGFDFDLAAMRFHSVAEAKHLRKMHRGTVFVAGLLIAAFVAVPIVNLATPLFAMALMVHAYKRIASSQ